MNSIINITDIYKNHPVLEDIAQRLELSETNAREKNDERTRRRTQVPAADNSSDDHSGTPGGKARFRSLKSTPEHARIYKFYANNEWQLTHHPVQPGRKPFENNLVRIFSREPAAIEIQIYSSSSTKGDPKDTIMVKLKTDTNIPKPDQTAQEENPVTQKILEQLGSLQQSVSEFPKMTEGNMGERLSQLNFGQQLKDIKHAHEMEMLKMNNSLERDRLVSQYEKRIEELEEEIEDLEEYVEELEAEKADADSELNGLNTKLVEAQSPPFVNMLGKIAASAAENLVKNNIDVIEKAMKVDLSELRDIMKMKEADEKAAISGGPQNSFSEIKSDLYSTVPADRKQYADAFLNMTHHVSAEDLSLLVALLNVPLNSNGTIKADMLKHMIDAGKNFNPDSSDNNQQ